MRTTLKPVLDLTNGKLGGGSTLISMIEETARASLVKKTKRHLYALSCYFDIAALSAFGRTVAKHVRSRGGTVASFNVAVDAGEWIRSRMTLAEIQGLLAKASGVPLSEVAVAPIQVRGRLLHAKAYAAISSADDGDGFVVVTSGNATERGLGLAGNANIELATVTTTPANVSAFKALFEELAEHEVSEKDALRQDRFLLALALFSAGAFYHRWQGSLSAEIRFKLTLTEAGREERKRNAAAFRGYEPDADTMSRDPLEIEQIFETTPKPFPASFWRTYSVDTLLGHWVPAPIAELVDAKLSRDVAPYVTAIRGRTVPPIVRRIARELAADIEEYAGKGWITETPTVVDKWSKRVKRFRENDQALKLRIHPYERVPDVLDSSSRAAVLQMESTLSAQLGSKIKIGGTKGVVDRFLRGELTRAELDSEFQELADDAAASLERHEA